MLLTIEDCTKSLRNGKNKTKLQSLQTGQKLRLKVKGEKSKVSLLSADWMWEQTQGARLCRARSLGGSRQAKQIPKPALPTGALLSELVGLSLATGGKPWRLVTGMRLSDRA